MPPKTGRKVFYGASSVEEIDPNRVRRLRSVVEAEAPDWVECVKEQAQSFPDDLVSIIYWSEYHCGATPEAVVAILENFREQGEGFGEN